MTVQPKDILESVALHLDNVAIRAEIETAVETYERSKRFLAGIKTRNGAPTKTKEAELES
jgi:hypothetical protein